MESPREFTCDFSGCGANYRRKEHLSRHKAQHIRQQSFKCPTCGRQFGRNDTLRRHVRRNHKVNEPTLRARRACTNCRDIKSRCEGGSPCSECLRRGIHCSLKGEDGETGSDSPSPLRDQGPSPSHHIPYGPDKVQHFIGLYFKLFHPHWPFVHRGSFDARNETPLLVQSMVVIGLWTSEEQSAQSAAIDLHKTLDSAIRQQTEKWDASVAEHANSACSWPIPTYQAVLLHVIFSLIYQSGVSIGLDLKPSLSAGIELLDSLVLSCRRLGMFYYPNVLARYGQNDLASYVWVCTEEVKRFNLALYKVCRAFSSSGKLNRNGEEYGVTGMASWGLTADELQFPMPKNDPLWNAVRKEEWDFAATEVDPTSIDDTMEGEWISKSTELLRFIEV